MSNVIEIAITDIKEKLVDVRSEMLTHYFGSEIPELKITQEKTDGLFGNTDQNTFQITGGNREIVALETIVVSATGEDYDVSLIVSSKDNKSKKTFEVENNFKWKQK